MARADENAGFTCAHCGAGVLPLTNGSYRNHCPFCLWSVHVDDARPGDRLSVCRGLMQPVELVSKRKGWQSGAPLHALRKDAAKQGGDRDDPVGRHRCACRLVQSLIRESVARATKWSSSRRIARSAHVRVSFQPTKGEIDAITDDRRAAWRVAFVRRRQRRGSRMRCKRRARVRLRHRERRRPGTGAQHTLAHRERFCSGRGDLVDRLAQRIAREAVSGRALARKARRAVRRLHDAPIYGDVGDPRVAPPSR